jgi:hypothetical protein
MSEPQFASLPGFITVREVRYRVQRPGFRVTTVTLVTTLLDAETYTVDALASLYCARWLVEISQPYYGSRASLSRAAA